ncbi:receptor-type tyrosine-protein kinase FLT3-like [Protopterus annectens]|uniref:receptor-type tyrosine-protein kinase FLT3-like n=1 Tax=Protopterus annectens TaxID=7888 RepID=UPI001CFA485D|nr:receptor-type tyrosine-protein kinase FLT3-like [Protopterus annectens]
MKRSESIKCILMPTDFTTIKPNNTVEIKIFDTIEVMVVINITGTICFWDFKKKRTPCTFNWDNRTVTSFKISEAREYDAGSYILTFGNESKAYSLRFTVYVKGKPRKPVFTFFKNGMKNFMICTAESYPAPTVYWYCYPENDRPCKHLPIGAKKVLDCTAESSDDYFGATKVSSKIDAALVMANNISCCTENGLGMECTTIHSLGN